MIDLTSRCVHSSKEGSWTAPASGYCEGFDVGTDVSDIRSGRVVCR